MIKRLKKLAWCGAVMLAMACHQSPGHLIPVEDFFTPTAKSSFHISPDGKYLSYIRRNHGKQSIVIAEVESGAERVVSNSEDLPIRENFWTNNNQLIISKNFGPDKYSLFAIDANTLQTRTLLTLEKINVRLISRRTANPDVVTFSMNKRDSATFDVYKLNTKTGDVKLYIKNPGNITEWFADGDGSIRLAKSSDGVNESILYRPKDNGSFKSIIVNNFKNRVEPIAFTGTRNYFYALSNVNRDKTALVQFDPEHISNEQLIFATDKADIDEVAYLKSKHRLEMVAWQQDKPQKYFVDVRIKNLYRTVSQQLPGYELKIIDRDTSEGHFLFNSYNDRDPGSVYLYHTNTNKLVKLADNNPKINPAELCSMNPVVFNASDGTPINGYLTLPNHATAKNLPVVVIPHNDPWRRVNWGYNDDVQFLANRGYAVFQVNYRGSTGYGKAFMSSGFKQLGGKMQDDIADGVKWLINQGIANPKRIALFGTGFGGFSALYGASHYPGLYSCAAVQFPLINMFTYVRDIPPYFKPMLSMRYEMVGNPETDADMFKSVSPVFNADKIKIPLLIYQGLRDPHGNASELNQFIRELRSHGVPVTFIAKPADWTNLRTSAKPMPKNPNQTEAQPPHPHDRSKFKIQLYTELEKFLATSLNGNK